MSKNRDGNNTNSEVTCDKFNIHSMLKNKRPT